MQVLLAFQHAPAGGLASVHDHPTHTHLEAIAATQQAANAIHQKIEQGIRSPQERALYEAAIAARKPWPDGQNRGPLTSDRPAYGGFDL